jgi:hypothetical protein
MIKIISNKYIHNINKNIYNNILCNINNKCEYSLRAIYFINTLINDNYFEWIENQIKMIYNYCNIIYIIAIVGKKNETKFKQKVWKIYPNVIIECSYYNNYEYEGIYKMWELGQLLNNKNDILLYFHSKGLSRINNYSHSIWSLVAKYKYDIILYDYNKIKDIFNIFPEINKIGYSCDKYGFIWYNFYFVRSSYIFNLERPIKTKRRHYYEDYLCRVADKDNKYPLLERKLINYNKNILDCYNIHQDNNTFNIGSYYCTNICKFINI